MSMRQPSPGEEPGREAGSEFGGLFLPGPGLARRQLAADQIMRHMACCTGEPAAEPLDKAVFGALRSEWRRLMVNIREELDPVLPVSAQLRFASLFAPETLPGAKPEDPVVELNRVVEYPTFHRYFFTCHLRNRDGESVVVSSRGLFALSPVGGLSGERPVAVLRVSIELPLAARERYLEEPHSVKPMVDIMLNRAAFDEQLNLIRSGQILEISHPRISVPLWVETLRSAECFLRGEEIWRDEGRLEVYGVRPPQSDRPRGEVVLETNCGLLLARLYFDRQACSGGGNVLCSWAEGTV